MERTGKSSKASLQKSRSRRKAVKADYYDFSLVAVVVLLTCFGLIMLYSTSAYTAELQFGDDMHFFKRQALISVASILGALLFRELIIIFLYILRGFCILRR